MFRLYVLWYTYALGLAPLELSAGQTSPANKVSTYLLTCRGIKSRNFYPSANRPHIPIGFASVCHAFFSGLRSSFDPRASAPRRFSPSRAASLVPGLALASFRYVCGISLLLSATAVRCAVLTPNRRQKKSGKIWERESEAGRVGTIARHFLVDLFIIRLPCDPDLRPAAEQVAAGIRVGEGGCLADQ